MTVQIFNACLLVGWLLVLVGGVIVNPGVGLFVAGVLLVVLTFVVSRVFGVAAPAFKPEGEGD